MFRKVLEMFYDLPVEEVMKKTGYAVVPKDTRVEVILETLIDFGHIWVTEHPNSNRLVGIIARKDFVDMVMPPQQSRRSTPGAMETRTLYYEQGELTAEDMMTGNVIKVEVDRKVADALRLMKSHFVRQLPVTRKDDLVGEISMRDLIRNYVELFKQERRKEESEKQGPEHETE